MSASSLKDRAVQRRVFIAAGIWAAVPAAVLAVLICIRLLASMGILPDVVPGLAVLAVVVAALLWMLIPIRKSALPPLHYFERFSISEGERRAGLVSLVVVLIVFYVLWQSSLFGLLG